MVSVIYCDLFAAMTGSSMAVASGHHGIISAEGETDECRELDESLVLFASKKMCHHFSRERLFIRGTQQQGQPSVPSLSPSGGEEG